MLPSSDICECCDELSGHSDELVDVTASDVAAIPIITDVLSGSFNEIRLVHHNVQGLLSKTTDLRVWLEACVGSASVFCFTETWVRPETPCFSVPGFQVFHSPFVARDPSTDDRFLPGSCLFVADALSPEHSLVCQDIERSCVSLNVTCCFLTCQHYKVAVVSIYRSPSTAVSKCMKDLHDLLSQLFLHCKYVMLAGDLNIDLLRSSSSQQHYSDLLVDFQLVQHVQEPTRVSSLSSTLIDHVLCSRDISVISVIQATGVSDHRVQVVDFEIAFQHNSVPSCCVRSFKKCCWDDVRSYLSTAAWSVLNIFNDINDMWEFFYSVLQNCLDSTLR